MKADLLKGSILKNLIIFAIPLFISNLFQQLYNAVDTTIVGNFLGDSSLAAIGASGAVFELLVGFTFATGNGMSIVTARFFGADDAKNVKKSVAASLVIGVGVSLIIMLISKLFLYSLLQFLSTPENIIDETYSYISRISLFIIVMFGYNLLAGLLRAVGNSVAPLVFLIVSSILNIALDLLFILHLKMGIEGAAIATIIAQIISASLCLFYMYKKTPILIPSKIHFKYDKKLYRELLTQGLSMGMMLALVCIGTVILQFGINNLGYLTIAGHVAARKLNSFFLLPIITMAVALSTFVSQNKGANQRDRILKGVKYANILSVVMACMVFIFLIFFSRPAVKFLSGSENAVILNNGTKYLLINSPFYMVLSFLLNTRYSLQGLGEKLLPLVSSVIELVGKIVFVIFIIPKTGYIGVIFSEPIIWCLMAIQLLYTFYNSPYIKGEKESNRKIVKEKN